MDTRKVFQYGLLILLFIVSFLFYYRYFAEEDKKIDLNKSENIVKKKILKLIKKIQVKI